jgi:uncharacterized membrane protein YccC
MKLLFGLLAMALMFAFLGSIMRKVPEVALIAVVAIGFAAMIYDFIESLRDS